MKTKGINHLALVCRDMAETVAFYTEKLGMPLVKTVALPDGGQHFFFDCGGDTLLAFFWWPDAPPATTPMIAMWPPMRTAFMLSWIVPAPPTSMM